MDGKEQKKVHSRNREGCVRRDRGDNVRFWVIWRVKVLTFKLAAKVSS